MKPNSITEPRAMDTTVLEALYTLTRAVHDMAPDDAAVRDLLFDCEAELRAGLPDPSQTDFRDRLTLMGQHAETLAGSA